MRLWRRYSAGLVLAVAAGATVLLALPPALRLDAAWGATLALLVQAPLGWWVLRSIATPRFQLAWALGIGIRLVVVGLAAVVLIPALGWHTAPALGSMVTALLLLLAVEVVAAAREPR